MADEMTTEDVFMAHMENAVRRSQEIWPDDWRNHHTFYDGEVARLLDTLRQADEPRAIVRAFALAMERKLAANDGGKGNWHDDGEWNHLLYAEAEMDELKQAMADFRNALATMFQRAIFPDENAAEKQRAAVETAMQRVNDLKQAVLDEAADVANYLMFACDVIGALPKTNERGR